MERIIEAASRLDYHQGLNLAQWLALSEIRAQKRGDLPTAERLHNQLVGVASSRECPNLFLLDLTERLGRVRAAAVGVEDYVIARACS